MDNCWNCYTHERYWCGGASCNGNPVTCGDAITNEIPEETRLELFKQDQLTVFQNLIDVVTAKKKLEETEKEIKEELKKAMEKCNVKKFENEFLNISYVAETVANSIDSVKLKKKYPDVATECSKSSKRSAYVKVMVK